MQSLVFSNEEAERNWADQLVSEVWKETQQTQDVSWCLSVLHTVFNHFVQHKQIMDNHRVSGFYVLYDTKIQIYRYKNGIKCYQQTRHYNKYETICPSSSVLSAKVSMLTC